MKTLTVGILAHVDAGKTTLSEALLYTAGTIRKIGRVDHGDAFLDTDAMERERGITIFSKQAVMEYEGTRITLLDTPGHSDFSAETERVLGVLDYAILLISATDGVQSHTRTLWKLLEQYRVPVFLFVNKMDQPGTDRTAVLNGLKKELSPAVVDFTGAVFAAGNKEMSAAEGKSEAADAGHRNETADAGRGSEAADAEYKNETATAESREKEAAAWQEEAASADEELLERFLENGSVSDADLSRAAAERKLFPCCFGSALKAEGISAFLKILSRFSVSPVFPASFGAKIFKVSRDRQGTRLTQMKITGGSLKVKALLNGKDRFGRPWEEKTDQIRIYSGEKYTTAEEVPAGNVVAVTGLGAAWAGEGIGLEADALLPFLRPVLTYRMILPEGTDPTAFFPKLRELEEEEPLLHAVPGSGTGEPEVEVMGEVQTEILKRLIADRFGISVSFGEGSILYRETVTTKAEGVGHYEPLRHYAEVHLLLSPGEPGSGLVFDSVCSEDQLSGNWQRLVLTHLAEKEHRGVLCGFPITDMKLTLLSGRAHVKHTEGGDFREATYRAVRQGLMQAESVLLEPFYTYRIDVPSAYIGRVMTDLKKLCALDDEMRQENGTAVFTGKAPVSTMRNYDRELRAFTGGNGKITLVPEAYKPCHNPEEVMAACGYQPEADTDNPSSSVFCEHGAGFTVPWNEVFSHMHLEASYRPERAEGKPAASEKPDRQHSVMDRWIDPDEVDAILERTFHANRKGEKNKSRVWKYSHRDPCAEYRGGEPAGRPAEKQGTAETGLLSGKNTLLEKGTASGKNLAPGKGTAHSQGREAYILIDGYNVIFAWAGLAELAEKNIDAARGKLLDILCNYQALKGHPLIAVFDAYRVKQHPTEIFPYHNIHVVFTKTAETADSFIEKFAHDNHARYDITVVTSDGLEQIIIRSQDCRLLSSRDFEMDVRAENEKMREILKKELSGA